MGVIRFNLILFTEAKLSNTDMVKNEYCTENDYTYVDNTPIFFWAINENDLKNNKNYIFLLGLTNAIVGSETNSNNGTIDYASNFMASEIKGYTPSFFPFSFKPQPPYIPTINFPDENNQKNFNFNLKIDDFFVSLIITTTIFLGLVIIFSSIIILFIQSRQVFFINRYFSKKKKFFP